MGWIILLAAVGLFLVIYFCRRTGKECPQCGHSLKMTHILRFPDKEKKLYTCEYGYQEIVVQLQENLH